VTPGRLATRLRAAIALVLFALPLPALADDGPPAIVADIRRVRDRYNAALQARDLPTVRRLLVDDYVGLPGSSGNLVASGDAMIERFAVAFSDPAFITYVRTPVEVRVAKPAERAMERGRWVARYRTDKTRPRFSGEYLAIWVPSPQGWRLRSESFVTLAGPPAP
jgi:ketosteroid isomerase-like protein